MLRLEELARQRLTLDPYPHIVFGEALSDLDRLNDEFPAKDRFGPTIRMDGDLTAGDPGYDELVSTSSAYGELHRSVYSAAFVSTFLELFRGQIARACESGQLLLDPFALDIVAEPVEKRVSGQSFVGTTDSSETFLYPRLDIGYGGVGYGKHNGGRGVHIDNLPRLISVMVFLNTPRSMVGGTHRLYGLHRGAPVLEKVYSPAAGLMIASLQSNHAFHDVEPIEDIDGERRALYLAVSCSKPIWKKQVDRKLSALSQNRYDPPEPSRIARGLRRLLSMAR